MNRRGGAWPCRVTRLGCPACAHILWEGPQLRSDRLPANGHWCSLKHRHRLSCLILTVTPRDRYRLSLSWCPYGEAAAEKDKPPRAALQEKLGLS